MSANTHALPEPMSDAEIVDAFDGMNLALLSRATGRSERDLYLLLSGHSKSNPLLATSAKVNKTETEPLLPLNGKSDPIQIKGLAKNNCIIAKYARKASLPTRIKNGVNGKPLKGKCDFQIEMRSPAIEQPAREMCVVVNARDNFYAELEAECIAKADGMTLLKCRSKSLAVADKMTPLSDAPYSVSTRGDESEPLRDYLVRVSQPIAVQVPSRNMYRVAANDEAEAIRRVRLYETYQACAEYNVIKRRMRNTYVRAHFRMEP